MRPRTLGKIVVAVLMVCALLVAILFALGVDTENLHKGYRAVTYAIIALTFAVLYRYFED